MRSVTFSRRETSKRDGLWTGGADRSSNSMSVGTVDGKLYKRIAPESETGAFSAFGFDYRRKRSVLIIVVIIGVWTVSVPDCPSGGA